MQQNIKNLQNIQNLQILRFFAATVVVYHHIVGTPSPVSPLPNFGGFGVDIFFCLSGFVMAMLVQNGEKPLRFIINRFIRIAPLYWIFTTLILVLTFVKPDLFAYTSNNLENYAKSLFFIPYFKESGSMHPMLSVGWTLNYEILFYGIIAFAIALSRQHTIFVTALLIMVIYVAGKLSNNALLTEFIGSELLFEFLFGVIIYHFWKKDKFNWLPQKLALTLLFTTIIAICVFEVYRTQMNRALCLGVPSAFILLTTLRCEGMLNKSAWLTKILTHMGDASYATYITHYFVVYFLRKILDNKLQLFDATSPFGVAIGIILALIVGQIVYKLLDKPLNKWLRQFTLGHAKVN